MTQRDLLVQMVEAGELRSLASGEPSRAPEQLPLPFYGKTIDVDGMRDASCDQIVYWGKAVPVHDNVYKCYANVWGTFCIVEITVREL